MAGLAAVAAGRADDVRAQRAAKDTLCEARSLPPRGRTSVWTTCTDSSSQDRQGHRLQMLGCVWNAAPVFCQGSRLQS